MELAVISPLHALSVTVSLRYQWAVTSLMEHRDYREYFLRQSDMHKHVILMQDNRIQPFLLAQYAEDIGASELVLPFVEDSYYETMESAKETLMGIAVSREASGIIRGLRPRIMLVIQGEDIYDWSQCLRKISAAYLSIQTRYPKLFPFPPVFGIQSKMLAKLSDEQRRLLVGLIEGYHQRMTFQTHLLNWNTLTTYGINFRSVSTNVPFVRASGLLLNTPPKFMERPFSAVEQEIATKLIKECRKKI